MGGADKMKKDKYWICDKCAKEQEAKPHDKVVTCMMGYCGWCNGDDKVTLTPIRDFYLKKGTEVFKYWLGGK